jgi:hypothetical protein
VTRPTLAVIGEGGEDEFVVPASKMPRGGGGVAVTVNLGGVQAGNLDAAASAAAVKVYDAVRNSGQYARGIRHGLERRL